MGLGLGDCRPGFAQILILKVILSPIKRVRWKRTRPVRRWTNSNLASFRLEFTSLNTGIIGALSPFLFLGIDTWLRTRQTPSGRILATRLAPISITRENTGEIHVFGNTFDKEDKF